MMRKKLTIYVLFDLSQITVTHALRYGEKIQIKNDMVELEKF